jgi:aryl-alcohol dehydrogenase-like predicted oxidoreductase
MKINELGRTGIKVSRICLGTMTFGEQNSQAEGFAQMDMAVDVGVNFFDTAEAYSFPGKPETQGQGQPRRRRYRHQDHRPRRRAVTY